MKKYHIYRDIHSFFVRVYIYLYKERELDAIFIVSCILYSYKYL